MRPLYVAVMGDIGTDVTAAVEAALAAHFGRAVRRIELPDPQFAFDARRGQCGSVPVLQALVEACPPGAWRILGITARDLFIPMLTFVFGQAQLAGNAAVISLARLRQEFYGMPADPALLVARARKEALHEVGHTLGLVHCAQPGCAMALATNIGQLDRKGADFCGRCRAAIERRRQAGNEGGEI
jgi:archaemetzincin